MKARRATHALVVSGLALVLAAGCGGGGSSKTAATSGSTGSVSASSSAGSSTTTDTTPTVDPGVSACALSTAAELSAALGDTVSSLEQSDASDDGKHSGFAGHVSRCTFTTASGAMYVVKLYSAVAPELASQLYDLDVQGGPDLPGVGDKATAGPGRPTATVLKGAQTLDVGRTDPLPDDLNSQLAQGKESGDTTAADAALAAYYGSGVVNITTVMGKKMTGQQSGIR